MEKRNFPNDTIAILCLELLIVASALKKTRVFGIKDIWHTFSFGSLAGLDFSDSWNREKLGYSVDNL